MRETLQSSVILQEGKDGGVCREEKEQPEFASLVERQLNFFF